MPSDLSHLNDNVSPDELPERHGEKFNPAIHAVDANNAPVVTASGKYRKKRSSNKSSSSLKDVPIIPTNGLKCRAAAEGTVDTVIMLGMMLHPSFTPRYAEKDGEALVDEREAGIMAFARYYESKNITDIPPGIALSLWGITYIGTRLMDKKVREAISKTFGKWVSKDASLNDIGTNGKRENDAGFASGKASA